MAVTKSSNIDDPPESFYIVTGAIGVSLYSFLFILSSISMKYLYDNLNNENNLKIAKFGLFIFGSCGLSLIWDLPRWVEMLKRGDYRAQYAYALHLLANIFFYAGYSTVVLLFWQATKLTTQTFQFVYGCLPRNTLSLIYIVNASNIIFCTIGIIYCALSPSLDQFFDSYFYGIFQFHELLVNVIIVFCLLNNAFKLRGRILNFIKATRPAMEDDLRGTIDATINAMTRKMLQIFMIMICCAIGVILRVSILAIKYSDNQHNQGHTGAIQMYSASWFLFSDFLPRTLAILSFLFLLRKPKPIPREDESEVVEEIEDVVDEVLSFSHKTNINTNMSFDDSVSNTSSIPLTTMSKESQELRSKISTTNPMNDCADIESVDIESEGRVTSFTTTSAREGRNTDRSGADSKNFDITARDSARDSAMDSVGGVILESAFHSTSYNSKISE